MNIPGIKTDKAWLSVGLGMVFVIVFYLVVVSPFRTRNAEKREGLERLLTRLERYENKGYKIRNENWIKAEKAKLKEIKKAQHEYELFYQERDSYLEKIFESVNGEEIKDEALWTNRYIHGINVLLDKIKMREISFAENALPFRRWNLQIPTWDQIAPEQKRFWIIEELVNIILNEELKVDYLGGINFDTGNTKSANANTERYDVIPFTLKVSMNVTSLLLLINEFLKSKLSFEIKSIGIHGELNRVRILEGAEEPLRPGLPEERKGPRPSSVVDVVIHAFVPDFKTGNK
ncbi:hypothetical protein [Candidatus Scalindua japonica]|nr:hypothetical protein [Candidatus Scalindua japonica]